MQAQMATNQKTEPCHVEGYNQCLEDCLKSLQDAGVVVVPGENNIQLYLKNVALPNFDNSETNQWTMTKPQRIVIAKALRSYLLGKG